MFPSLAPDATTLDVEDGHGLYDLEGSKKTAVLTDDVWPRRVARRIGFGAVRACSLLVWSPAAVSWREVVSADPVQGDSPLVL